MFLSLLVEKQIQYFECFVCGWGCYWVGSKTRKHKAGFVTFFPSHAQTPGRLTMTDMGDFNVLVDYAHNKAGYDALIDFVSSYNPEKTIMTLCVPGDRRDEDFESVAESCAIM
jgi:cyanophycin synthetase